MRGDIALTFSYVPLPAFAYKLNRGISTFLNAVVEKAPFLACVGV
jgi:hypothetical protein